MKSPNFRHLKLKGFTLIEILGVMAVIAMLTAVALTAMTGAAKSAEVQSVNRQAQVFNSAYHIYIAAGGNMNQLDSLVVSEQIEQARAAVAILMVAVTTPSGAIGPFLPQNPTDAWFLDAVSMGKTITGDIYYIGFTAGLGFFMIEP